MLRSRVWGWVRTQEFPQHKSWRAILLPPLVAVTGARRRCGFHGGYIEEEGGTQRFLARENPEPVPALEERCVRLRHWCTAGRLPLRQSAGPLSVAQNLSLTWTLIAETADKRTELSTVTEHSRPNTGR